MSNGAIGAIIGICVFLVFVVLAIWLLQKPKESFKFKKGKIGYFCIQVPVDKKDANATIGIPTLLAISPKRPQSQFASIEDTKLKCGQFFRCTPAGVAGNQCQSVAIRLDNDYVTSLKECDSVCNKYNPAPPRNTVKSGNYLVKSSNNETFPNGAYLVTYYDCPTNEVYALLDPNATELTADIWTFDIKAGTIKTNKKYPSVPTNCNGPSPNTYPWGNQDLYVAIMFPPNDPQNRLIYMQPLAGGISSQYTLGWFLTNDSLSGGRIARDWNLPVPEDYACANSYFPSNSKLPFAQPFEFCRNIGSTGSLSFVPTRRK